MSARLERLALDKHALLQRSALARLRLAHAAHGLRETSPWRQAARVVLYARIATSIVRFIRGAPRP